jgi:hypothetical protein
LAQLRNFGKGFEIPNPLPSVRRREIEKMQTLDDSYGLSWTVLLSCGEIIKDYRMKHLLFKPTHMSTRKHEFISHDKLLKYACYVTNYD